MKRRILVIAATALASAASAWAQQSPAPSSSTTASVSQEDLGASTAELPRRIKRFDPDKTWKKSQ